MSITYAPEYPQQTDGDQPQEPINPFTQEPQVQIFNETMEEKHRYSLEVCQLQDDKAALIEFIIEKGPTQDETKVEQTLSLHHNPTTAPRVQTSQPDTRPAPTSKGQPDQQPRANHSVIKQDHREPRANHQKPRTTHRTLPPIVREIQARLSRNVENDTENRRDAHLALHSIKRLVNPALPSLSVFVHQVSSACPSLTRLSPATVCYHHSQEVTPWQN